MGHKKTWALVLGVITLVLFGFWLAPRLLPDPGWGLNELNQVAGIASLALAAATLVVTVWPTRSSAAAPSPPANPSPPAPMPAPEPGGVVNTITGNLSGFTVQAHTVHGGVGNTVHPAGGGDRSDSTRDAFRDPATGSDEEGHHRPGTARGDERL